jgi:hypothetical protein
MPSCIVSIVLKSGYGSAATVPLAVYNSVHIYAVINRGMFIYNKLTYIARKVWWRAGITQSVNAHEDDAKAMSSNLRVNTIFLFAVIVFFLFIYLSHS